MAWPAGRSPDVRGPLPRLQSRAGGRPPPLATAADLGRAVLLHNGAHAGEWSDWLDEAGIDGVDAQRGPVFDASNEVLAAAANGMGVALGRTPLVESDLEAGRLVAPFDTRVRSRGRYWLVAPEATADGASLSAFRGWLQAQVG
ncbi:MAG: LysR substrate-binding domain-containing protein [Halofilum sp. (in: g-proteobacteria)]|nr:LysR substrate-binding domain-containing protein [Halofilum sp. (in: g-proteobacteria)]